MIVHAQKGSTPDRSRRAILFYLFYLFIYFSGGWGCSPEVWAPWREFWQKKCRDVVNVCYEQIRAIDDMWLAVGAVEVSQGR